MWINYKWLRQVRGLTPREFRVMSYLSEEADARGVVSAVKAQSIARECETTKNNAFRILRILEEDKQFLRRDQRFEPQQKSNGYTINLARYRPANESAGLGIWSDLIQQLPDQVPTQIHAEGTEAYFNSETQTLSVWFDDNRGQRFFHFRIAELTALGICHVFKVKSFDFLIKVPQRLE